MQNITFNDKNEVIDATQKGKNDLKIVAQNNQLSEKFILENADFLDWSIISENQKITPEIIVKCAKKIKWTKITANPNLDENEKIVAKYKGDFIALAKKENNREHFLRTYSEIFEWKYLHTELLSESFLNEFEHKVEWYNVFRKDRKNEAFIRKHLPKIDAFSEEVQKMAWWYISDEQTTSEQFLRDFEHKINFTRVCTLKDKVVLSDAFVEDFKYALNPKYVLEKQKNNLSKAYIADYKMFDIENFYKNATEEWIRNYPYKNRLHWEHISEFVILSENFMREFADKLDWHNISGHQILSEGFLRKFKDKISWLRISNCQVLSENFMREFERKLHWKTLSLTQKMSAKFIEEFKHKL